MPEKILIIDDDVDTLRLVGLDAPTPGIPDQRGHQW